MRPPKSTAFRRPMPKVSLLAYLDCRAGQDALERRSAEVAVLVEDGHVADAALGQPLIAIQLDAQEPALLLRLLACTPRPKSRIGTPRQRQSLVIQFVAQGVGICQLEMASPRPRPP